MQAYLGRSSIPALHRNLEVPPSFTDTINPTQHMSLGNNTSHAGRLQEAGSGSDRYMKGSKVSDTRSQLGHTTVLCMTETPETSSAIQGTSSKRHHLTLNCPWNRSTMMESLRFLCAS